MACDPYTLRAGLYDPFVESVAKGIRSACLTIYPPQEGMIVLDVGCGTGTQLALYKCAGCRVLGIDRSAAMLAIARKKLGPSVDLRLGDARFLPYPDRSFDLVTCILALHEMPSIMRPSVLSEGKRVLKKDGRILLVDYQPGPHAFPDGWMAKAVVLFFEIAAGWRHFRNYRDFLGRRGLVPLIEAEQLSVGASKRVANGNVSIVLLSKRNE
jgi:ubiquinone/menaquinone biosynthesis C-methylase UbiE